jgi:hypothetical protein
MGTMRARLLIVSVLFAASCGPIDAATLPYLGSQVEVTGVVQAGATPDRIRVSDESGDVFEVVINRDSTYVSSHALLRANQVVRVDGRLTSGRDGAGQTIDADEIAAGTFDLSNAAPKSHAHGWSIALGAAAAGLLLGSGVYAFRKSLFGNNQPGNAAPGTSSLSSGVTFGGP